MQELDINELSDGDLVIYMDLDVEFKHNSNRVYISPVMIADKRLPYGTELKDFTHKVTNSENGKIFYCFIVKTTDEDYEYWNNMPNCTPYGYDNSIGE